MVKLFTQKPASIKLQRNNKIIERPLADYQANKTLWDFRGFKPVENVVKDNNEKIVELKPKAKNVKTKKTRSRGKKEIKEDL